MSRTYKRYTGNCFRSPRGHKQALVAGVRKSKVPPSAYGSEREDPRSERQRAFLTVG